MPLSLPEDQNYRVRGPDGQTLKNLLQLSGRFLAAFLPQGLLDFRDLEDDPDEPVGTLRSRMYFKAGRPYGIEPGKVGRGFDERFTVGPVTSDYAAGIDDDVVEVDTTGGNITVTCPPIALFGKRRFSVAKHEGDLNLLSVVAAEGDTIQAGNINPTTRDPFGGFELHSDGISDWHIVAKVTFLVAGRTQTGNLIPTASRFDGYGTLGDFTVSGNQDNYGRDEDGLFRNLVSGSGNNAQVGVESDDAVCEVASVPRLEAEFRWADSVNVRYFVGWSAETLSNTVDADAPSTEYVGLQWSFTRGDTALQFVSSDGVTQNVRSTSVALSTLAVYRLSMSVLDSTTIQLELRDEASILLSSTEFSTNIPAPTTGLNVVAGAHKTAAAGGGKTIDIYQLFVESR